MVFNIKNDIEVVPGVNDGISDLSFSPAADYLAATSWDNNVKRSSDMACLIFFVVENLGSSIYWKLYSENFNPA
jgi:hypothetical protein